MKLLPAIDLQQGKCVQLVGGNPEQARVRVDDPVGQATRWVAAGAEALHVIDLDAALDTGRTNRDVVRAILDAVDVPVQVGGGVRSTPAVEELLAAGAERVILGTKAVRDPEWLKEMARRFGPRIMVAVDARGGEIVVRGWREASGTKLLDFVGQVDKLGLGALLFTDVDVEGTLRGMNERLVKSVVDAAETPVQYAGGLASLDELLMLAELGVDASILGMALYTGRIDLGEALGALEG